MGRHSSGATWPFVRSIVAWALPWLLGAFVVTAAVWTAVTMLGGDAAEVAVAPSPTPTRTPSPTPAITPEPADPTPTEEPSPEETGGAEVSFEGTTAQVLNGSGVAGAAEVMADRLARLGFEVVAVEDAVGRFERTTVYWTSEESRPHAEALAGANGWQARPKPENLSDTVEIHVVVGVDEA